VNSNVPVRARACGRIVEVWPGRKEVSEIARYWAAKGLTQIEAAGRGVALRALFAKPAFTIRRRLFLSREW